MSIVKDKPLETRQKVNSSYPLFKTNHLKQDER